MNWPVMYYKILFLILMMILPIFAHAQSSDSFRIGLSYTVEFGNKEKTRSKTPLIFYVSSDDYLPFENESYSVPSKFEFTIDGTGNTSINFYGINLFSSKNTIYMDKPGNEEVSTEPSENEVLKAIAMVGVVIVFANCDNDIVNRGCK